MALKESDSETDCSVGAGVEIEMKGAKESLEESELPHCESDSENVFLDDYTGRATPQAVPALVAIAFIESSSFFPIPPDVLLLALPMVLPNPSKKWAHLCLLPARWASVTVGGLCGGTGLVIFFMIRWGRGACDRFLCPRANWIYRGHFLKSRRVLSAKWGLDLF